MNEEVKQKYKLYTDSFEKWLAEEIKKQEDIVGPLRKEMSDLRRKGKIIGLNEILKRKTADKCLANLGEIKKEYTSLIGFQDFNLKKILDVQLIFEEPDFRFDSGTIKSNLEKIGAELSEKVQKQINDQLNSVIYDRMKKINSHLDNIKNLLKKVKLSENNVYQVIAGREMSLSLGTSSRVISKVAFFKDQTLDRTVNLNFKDNKLQLDFDRAMGIYGVNIDELFNNLRHNIGSLDKNTQYVVKNFSTLKEQYVEYKRLLSLQNSTDDIIKYIEKDFNLKRSFKELIDTLKKVYSEFKEKTDKLEKKLRECEFEKIVKSVYNEQRQQLGKKEEAEFLVAKYTELSKQYRAALNSNDTVTAKKIKQEMDEIYENASQEDRKKMNVKEQSSKIHEEDSKNITYVVEKQPENYLAELAVVELEMEGAFKAETEEIAGDIRYKSSDRELLIEKRIEEYKKITRMDPVQRALYINQKHGRFLGLTEKDLSPIEIEQFNLKYGDESLAFVKYCREIEEKEKKQNKVNSIYKYYIIAKAKGYTGNFSSYVRAKAEEMGINFDEITDKMIKEAIEIGEGRKK